MFYRIKPYLKYLKDPLVLLVIAVITIICLFVFGGTIVKIIAFWMAIALVLVLLVWLVVWLIKKARSKKPSEALGDAIADGGSQAEDQSGNADVDALRGRMREAVKAIKTSKLGASKGHEALYELPWYMIIGNPAAGKSTAIVNSGLRFPFSKEHGPVVQGIGGTRNCDWYFTSEGILLDTAGRYSVHEDNRSEWLKFLDILRRNRPRAPINGIIIAASVAELTDNRPEFAIDLAKKLRRRVQELTDRLEVVAPVYVMFTKSDLISGFGDFFRNLDDQECHRVWGATLPFRAEGSESVEEDFDHYFDELSDGLQEMSLAQLSYDNGDTLAPGMLNLPLEFSGIKSSLRTFISTLFEDNPYQYRPVFRGFYFTSALQEPASVDHASKTIAKRFHLTDSRESEASEQQTDTRSYFLLDLFRKVMFADKHLVRQYSSKNRKRTRYGILIGCAAILGLVLGSWSWSYTSNMDLVSRVKSSLNHAVAVQKGRVDLESRLEALQVLQKQLKELEKPIHSTP